MFCSYVLLRQHGYDSGFHSLIESLRNGVPYVLAWGGGGGGGWRANLGCILLLLLLLLLKYYPEEKKF